MKRTREEKNLLDKLASGALDGMVGDEREYRGYKSVYCGKYIKNGEPVSYRKGESTRFFNGKENERIPGNIEEDHYDTDDRKLEFLQRYGWLIRDDDARAYSAKFKPQKMKQSTIIKDEEWIIMKKRILALCLALVIICLLSACVRIDATVKVNSNGTVDIRMLYAVSSALASLGDDNESFGLTDEEITAYKEKGITYEVYTDTDAGYIGYILNRKGIKLRSSEESETGIDSIVNGDFFTANGNRVIVSFVPFSDSEYEKSGSYIGLIKSYGGYMNFNLELPVNPISHNATSVSDDGKTLTWDLTTLGANDKIYAEFDMPSHSFLIWLLPVVGAIVVAVVIVLVFIKKRNKKGVQDSIADETISETTNE